MIRNRLEKEQRFPEDSPGRAFFSCSYTSTIVINFHHVLIEILLDSLLAEKPLFCNPGKKHLGGLISPGSWFARLIIKNDRIDHAMQQACQNACR